MDRRKRTARTVALMSLFSMTDTQENVPVASFDGDGSDLVSLIVGIEPVQAGSGDPSPDNVRPISGWTGATVTRTGINVWDEEWEKGGFNDTTGEPTGTSISTQRSKNSIKVLSSTAYYFVCETTLTGNPSIMLCEYDANGNYLGATYKYVWAFSFTTKANTGFLKFRVYNAGISQLGSAGNLSINYPATDTSYHAYQGDTYSITFPSSVGNVYGGTLDVTQGKLTVDRANIASYNGEQLPSKWISDRDVYAVGTTPTTGAQVVYDLATPIVYDLTPTEINTLIGANNIWADTGEIKYIEYNI